MKTINSQDNKIYKLCVQLGQKKYRDRLGKYIAEGENLVREALNSEHEVHLIVMREDLREDLVKEFNDQTDRFDSEVFMKGNLFDKVAQTNTSQGVFAIVDKMQADPGEYAMRMKTIAEKRRCGGNLVVLDRLQDPGNIGTIIRTADAAGFGGVLAIKGTGDIYSPKVVRAAAGSLFRMPVFCFDSGTEAVNFLKANHKTVISTCFDTDKSYADTDMSQDTAIIIGNEGNGISDELIAMSDVQVKIPMESAVDSLNAAVAAGILMYHARA